MTVLIFPCGDWKVTRTEYDIARNISIDNDPIGNAAYQLVRYCHGEVYDRKEAEAALTAIRTCR